MQAYHNRQKIDIYVQSDTVELTNTTEGGYRIMKGYAEKSTCKYPIETLECFRRVKEPVFMLPCSRPSCGMSGLPS